MAYSPYATKNKLVAVGDGPTPLKTIGLYSDPYSIGSNISTNSIQFNQIFTGGFSSIGYGVTYYTNSSLWVAVGVHNISANTIQYSLDGSNWKPANVGAVGVRTSGTSITLDEFKGTTKIIVTGSDPLSNRCILVGDDTIGTWRASLGSVGFSGNQANASAITPDVAFVVGSRNSNGTTSLTETIKYTINTSNWSAVTTGGFSNAGYGIAAKYPIYPYVISGSSLSNNTIRYSSDGINWSDAYNGLYGTTNCVHYSKYFGMYVAGGGSGASKTILYSKDGKNWSYGYGGHQVNTSFVTSFRDPAGIPCFWSSGYDIYTPNGDKPRISYDGIHWSTITHPFNNKYWDASYNLVGSPNYNPNNVVSGPVFGLVKIGNVYAVSGFGASANNYYTQTQGRPKDLAYSYDLINWSDGLGITPGIYSVALNMALGKDENGTEMAVFAGGTFSSGGFVDPYGAGQRSGYSYDGITWSGISGPQSDARVFSVAYGNGLWVIGGINTYGDTLYYSTNGRNYVSATSGQFTTNGYGGSYNGLSFNETTGIWTALGQDTNGYTVKYSGDGMNWSNCTGSLVGDSTNLTLAYGATSAGFLMPALSTIIVAVGDPGSSNSRNSIQYSYDGKNFYPPSTTSAYIKGIGYGVNYNPAISTFFAVGKDATGNASSTILRSVDGLNWSTNQLASFSNSTINDYQKGFPSQTITGNVRRIAFQYLTIPEEYPYVKTNDFNLYQRAQSNSLLGANTIRYVSSFMTFGETLSFNLSSQMMINSNTPYPGAVLTVNGSLYASSISFTGNQNQVANIFLTSTMTVSSLYLQNSLITYDFVSSGTLTIEQQSSPKKLLTANQIVSYMGNAIKVNSITISPSTVGINTSTPQASLQIGGTTGSISTFAGTVFTSLSTINTITNSNTLMSFNTSFGLYSQTREPYSTSMITTSNFLSFNNLFYLRSVSSIGIGTSSPSFSLDVRYPVNTYSILSSPSITLQVLRPSVVYL